MNEKQLKQVIEAYSKMPADQLMSELAKHMAAQRAKDGGANMRTMIERIKPFLTPDQRGKLEEVLRNVEQQQ